MNIFQQIGKKRWRVKSFSNSIPFNLDISYLGTIVLNGTVFCWPEKYRLIFYLFRIIAFCRIFNGLMFHYCVKKCCFMKSFIQFQDIN